jgi:hypothetical protein
MIRTLSLAALLASTIVFSAAAADTNITVPATTSQTAAAPTTGGMSLTADEAKTWVNKAVYSSDGKAIGKVADIQRDADNKVTGMHANIGGLWGFGQTRVELKAAQFTLHDDRILLNLTAAQAKELPKAQI